MRETKGIWRHTTIEVFGIERSDPAYPCHSTLISGYIQSASEQLPNASISCRNGEDVLRIGIARFHEGCIDESKAEDEDATAEFIEQGLENIFPDCVIEIDVEEYESSCLNA